MQKNLIYLCGPHGSGKTTLGKEIRKEDSRIVIPELFSRNVKFSIEDAEYRQVLKIGARAIENFEYLNYAKNNPEKIILGNRCIYDVLAYNWIYFMKGWINEQTYNNYNLFTLCSFKNENLEPLAIIVSPGMDAVKRHLQKRWNEKGKKWREEDMQYAKLACQAYERFNFKKNILYLDKEINLESGEDIKIAYKWIKNKTLD